MNREMNLTQVEVDTLLEGLHGPDDVIFRVACEPAMNWLRAVLAFGEGDVLRGLQNISMLARRMEEARAKHRLFAGDKFGAVRVISCEFHEFCYAVTHESPDRQLDEALDVATTAMRFVNGEHRKKEEA